MRANSLGAILGALCGFASALLLRNEVSFIWYAVTGCLPTIVCGYGFSFLAPPESRAHVYPMTIWGRNPPEPSGPQRLLVILEGRFVVERAGGGIDLIVDDAQLARA